MRWQLGRDCRRPSTHGFCVDTLGPVRHDAAGPPPRAAPGRRARGETRRRPSDSLSASLHEAEQHLLAGDRLADRRDHRVLRRSSRPAGPPPGHSPPAGGPAVLAACGQHGADESPRDRRGAQPKRLRGPSICTVRSSRVERPPRTQARVHRPRLLELRVGPIPDRDLLIGEINGPGLRRPPAHQPRESKLESTPRGCRGWAPSRPGSGRGRAAFLFVESVVRFAPWVVPSFGLSCSGEDTLTPILSHPTCQLIN